MLEKLTCVSKSECGLPILQRDSETRAKTTFSTYKDLQKSYRKSEVKRTISQLNKSLGKQNKQASMASKEMREELQILKEYYITVCEQESALRSQIALLTAELVLMETNEYHRVPLKVRHISVNPLSLRKIPKTKLGRPQLERPHSIAKHLSVESAFDKSNKLLNRMYRPGKLATKAQHDTEKVQNVNKPRMEAKLPSPKPQNTNNTHLEENMFHYCPYCSVFCHPSQAPLPCAMRILSPACLADFRLPKLNVQPLKATVQLGRENGDK